MLKLDLRPSLTACVSVQAAGSKEHVTKWVFFTLGCICFTLLQFNMWYHIRPDESSKRRRAYDKLLMHITAVWILYPIFWLCGPKVSQSVCVYVCYDAASPVHLVGRLHDSVRAWQHTAYPWATTPNMVQNYASYINNRKEFQICIETHIHTRMLAWLIARCDSSERQSRYVSTFMCASIHALPIARDECFWISTDSVSFIFHWHSHHQPVRTRTYKYMHTRGRVWVLWVLIQRWWHLFFWTCSARWDSRSFTVR